VIVWNESKAKKVAKWATLKIYIVLIFCNTWACKSLKLKRSIEIRLEFKKKELKKWKLRNGN
jgi:hypothetical protein